MIFFSLVFVIHSHNSFMIFVDTFLLRIINKGDAKKNFEKKEGERKRCHGEIFIRPHYDVCVSVVFIW